MAELAYCFGKCGRRWEREAGEGLYCSPACEARAQREREANEAELLGRGFERDPVATNGFTLNGLMLTAEEVYWDGLEVALAKIGYGIGSDGRLYRIVSGASEGSARPGSGADSAG